MSDSDRVIVRHYKINGDRVATTEFKPMLYSVVLPGAVGGAAKATWETVDPSLVDSETNVTVIPAYAFLGSVSAVLAFALLFDFIKKTYTKLIGLSIACGLVFPSVLNSSVEIVKLQTQLNQSKTQTIEAVETVADVSFANADRDAKILGISELTDLAIESDNSEVRAEILKILKAYEPRPNPEVNQELRRSITKIESLPE